MKDLFKGAWTVPNALSLLRILLIPVFAYLFYIDQIGWAILVLVISAVSDLLDGKIARRFNQVSELGKMLDPIADKLSQAAIAIVLILRYDSAIRYLFAFFIVKELIMLLAGCIMLSKGKRPVAAEIWGKLATTVFYTVMIFIVAFGEGGALTSWFQLPGVATWILVIISAVFTVIALLSYVPGFIKAMKDED